MPATLIPQRRDQQTLRRSRRRVSLTGRKRNSEPGASQLGLMWHTRGRNYSPAEGAAWALEAEALTPLDTAAEASLTGASGGKVITHESLSTEWTPVLSTNLKSGEPLTHQGLYNVIVRAYTTSEDAPWQWQALHRLNPVRVDN